MDALTKVYHDHPKIVLFSSAAAVRIVAAVAFPGLPDLLTLRAELSTPVNSFKRCAFSQSHLATCLDEPYSGAETM
jgi:GPI-anchor transamidase subunit U